jgi:hypothetical protein
LLVKFLKYKVPNFVTVNVPLLQVVKLILLTVSVTNTLSRQNDQLIHLHSYFVTISLLIRHRTLISSLFPLANK